MPDTVLASGIPVVSKEDMVPAIREVQVTRGASKKKKIKENCHYESCQEGDIQVL